MAIYFQNDFYSCGSALHTSPQFARKIALGLICFIINFQKKICCIKDNKRPLYGATLKPPTYYETIGILKFAMEWVGIINREEVDTIQRLIMFFV
jgi:hypothetical protein